MQMNQMSHFFVTRLFLFILHSLIDLTVFLLYLSLTLFPIFYRSIFCPLLPFYILANSWMRNYTPAHYTLMNWIPVNFGSFNFIPLSHFQFIGYGFVLHQGTTESCWTKICHLANDRELKIQNKEKQNTL